MKFDKNEFDKLIELADKVAHGQVTKQDQQALERAAAQLGMGNHEKPHASVVFGARNPSSTKGNGAGFDANSI